ncbi:MAG: hypothetical protein K6A62_01295 [Bacteroidales bacterium]|nr:hypothetical protein [Bacteroidales bacterium]
MKKVILFLLYALFFSLSSIAGPGDGNDPNGGTSIPLPGGGVIVIRPELGVVAPVDIDRQSGTVIVWGTPTQPVNVRMVEMESGFTQTHTAFMPDVLQFQQQPDLVYVTVEYDGEVVLYAYSLGEQ